MHMSLEEKDENGNIISDQRFAKLQELETIRFGMPHHDEMQRLVGSAVARAVGNIENPELDADGRLEIAEIGTGKGFTAEEVLKANPNVRIVGADNDAGMIRQAQENLEQYIQEGRVELRSEDALEFLKKFPDNSVSIIESGFTIHNFKNDYRKAVLEEIYRVLKLGGEFITADKIMPDDEEIFQEEVSYVAEQFQNIPDEEKRKEWMRHYEEDMRPDVIMREGELIEMLQEIGFREIDISNRNHLEALLVAKK